MVCLSIDFGLRVLARYGARHIAPFQEYPRRHSNCLVFTCRIVTIISTQRYQFDKSIFIFALLFPFYVTLINIVRLEISWKEVLLYWFWVTGVYLVLPAMLQGEHIRRQAIKVLFWTNLLVLFVGIFLGVLKGQYYVIGHGDRMVFSFLHPNYYSNSWQIVFAMAFYFALTVKRNLLRIAAYFIDAGFNCIYAVSRF